MVVVAQLVRASDCGSEGRGFEPHHPPQTLIIDFIGVFLFRHWEPDLAGRGNLPNLKTYNDKYILVFVP